jgi:putative endonuclease
MRRGWVYILVGRTGTLYTGVTSDLYSRVLQHRNGIKSGFASKYDCNRLAYFEEYGDIRSAIGREKTIKGWIRVKKIALIESLNPEWKDLAKHWGSQMLMPGESIKEENERQKRRIRLSMDSVPLKSGGSE